ncbi:MAG: hypothetical protein O3A46_13515, partial [Candidatus Poribacteria bacterium]|nr:hypothetical protein [Candidatus Poribacteria bacterium]
HDHPHDFERTDWHNMPIVWAFVAFGALIVFGFVTVEIFLRSMVMMKGELSHIATTADLTREFPEPRLRPVESTNWNALKTSEEMKLHSYGWVNRELGVVHIPIEQAKAVALQRGFPTRENPTHVNFGKTYLKAPAAPTKSAAGGHESEGGSYAQH